MSIQKHGMTDLHRHAIGLLSSVTGDAVEAAVIESDGQDAIRSIGGVRLPCPDTLHWGLLEATQNDLPTTEILRLEQELTRHYVRAIDALRARYPDAVSAAAVVGLDGHTLRRLPEEGISHQIGNPWLLAEWSGFPVVSDFRRHDMAIGGQGAPLESMYHWALMAREPRPALMLNLSAVTSLTWLSRSNDIIAGDVGPGFEILDEWVHAVAECRTTTTAASRRKARSMRSAYTMHSKARSSPAHCRGPRPEPTSRRSTCRA